MTRTSYLAAAAALLLAACSQSGPGQLSVTLSSDPAADPAVPPATDPLLPGVDAIWVNVTKVRAVSPEGGWTDLSTTPVTVNLLALGDAGVDLGLANLPAGTVDQIRLVVAPEGNRVVLTGGAEAPLKVPSGSQSGIKIVGPFEVDECEETSVTLHLDGHRSIWAHTTGKGTDWILRPVIRATAEQGPGTCEPPATCVPAECASQLCDDTGTACAPGGFDAPCTKNEECLSNVCAELFCAPGAENTPCRGEDDCAAELTCTAGVCVATPPAAT